MDEYTKCGVSIQWNTSQPKEGRTFWQALPTWIHLEDNYAKGHKPITKGQTLYASTYTRLMPRVVSSQRQKAERWFPEAGRGEVMLNVHGVCSKDDRVLEIVMMVTQHCECTECHWTVCLRMVHMVNFMLCVLLEMTTKDQQASACHPHTFLRPSSSSSVRGPAWSFSNGLTKGEACLVSGLRLGDRTVLVGAAPPCELMDSSERWGLPVREPVWGWEVLKKRKKKVIPSGTWCPLTIFT